MFAQVLVPTESLWTAILLALVPLVGLLLVLAALPAWTWHTPTRRTLEAYADSSRDGAAIVESTVVVLAHVIVIGALSFRVVSQVMQT